MKEDEAKTKWCPFMRFSIAMEDGEGVRHPQQSAGFNALLAPFDSYATAEGRCIASACMAWRWTGPRIGTVPVEGFCGLSGALQ